MRRNSAPAPRRWRPSTPRIDRAQVCRDVRWLHAGDVADLAVRGGPGRDHAGTKPDLALAVLWQWVHSAPRCTGFFLRTQAARASGGRIHLSGESRHSATTEHTGSPCRIISVANWLAGP